MEKIEFDGNYLDISFNETTNLYNVYDSFSRFNNLINENSYLELKSLISKMDKLSKNYITHDYGQIFVNLHKKEIYICGGDSGIGFLSDDKLEKINLSNQTIDEFIEELFESGIEEDNIDFDDFDYMSEKLDEKYNIVYEAECYPNDKSYIYIGNLTLIF